MPKRKKVKELLPEGLLRTPEGWIVLKDDTSNTETHLALSRQIEVQKRLDVGWPEISRFQHYIPKGGVVVDAGANLGDHAISYADLVGPQGRVWAFEPDEMTFQGLCGNMTGKSQVTCLNAALAHVSVQGYLHRHHNRGASFMAFDERLEYTYDPKDPENRGRWSGTLTRLPVVVTTLDEVVLPQITRCDLLHLDAEGSEPYILCGAKRLIQQYRPVIICEFSDPHLRKLGMTMQGLDLLLNVLGYHGWPYSVVGEEQLLLALPDERGGPTAEDQPFLVAA